MLVAIKSGFLYLCQVFVLLVTVLLALEIGLLDSLGHLGVELVTTLGAFDRVALCHLECHLEILFDFLNLSAILLSPHPDVVLMPLVSELLVVCVDVLAFPEFVLFLILGIF